jgi:hypothetical protein
MGGLLEGLGMVVGGAMAGGGKVAADVFTEQIKQDALLARELNMARITNMYAKEGRTEQNKFTSDENKKQRQSAEDLAARAREERAVEGVFERGSRETINYESNKAADIRQDKTNQQALDLYKIESEAKLEAARIAGTKAESLVRLEASLRNAAPDDITKKINALSKYMDQKDAVSLVVDSYSGNRDKAKLYGDYINKTLANDNLNGIQQTPTRIAEIKATGEDLFDYHPKGGAVKQTTVTPEEELAERLKRVKGKSTGPDKTAGLIERVKKLNEPAITDYTAPTF